MTIRSSDLSSYQQSVGDYDLCVARSPSSAAQETNERITDVALRSLDNEKGKSDQSLIQEPNKNASPVNELSDLDSPTLIDFINKLNIEETDEKKLFESVTPEDLERFLSFITEKPERAFSTKLRYVSNLRFLMNSEQFKKIDPKFVQEILKKCFKSSTYLFNHFILAVESNNHSLFQPVIDVLSIDDLSRFIIGKNRVASLHKSDITCFQPFLSPERFNALCDSLEGKLHYLAHDLLDEFGLSKRFRPIKELEIPNE